MKTVISMILVIKSTDRMLSVQKID